MMRTNTSRESSCLKSVMKQQSALTASKKHESRELIFKRKEG